MNEQSTPILGVKSSDTRLCGGEAHLRVKKMSAASDSTKAVIEAATETLTGMISNLAYTLSTWTAIFANINARNKLEMKSSDNLPARIPGMKSRQIPASTPV